MLAVHLRRLSLPRSLRQQFILALLALELLIVAGGLTAVYALRVSATSTRQLVEERLVHMQDSHVRIKRRYCYQLLSAERILNHLGRAVP